MPGTILFIGSHQTSYAHLFKTLERHHFHILEAPSPVSAAEALKKTPIDLVLIADFERHGTAIPTCKRLKSHQMHAHIPAIILTLHKSDLDWGGALIAQADDLFLVAQNRTAEIINRVKFLTRENAKLSALKKRTFQEDQHGLQETVSTGFHPATVLCYGPLPDQSVLGFAPINWVRRSDTRPVDLIYLAASTDQERDLLDIQKNWSNPPPVLCEYPPQNSGMERELLELGASDLICSDTTIQALALRAIALIRRTKHKTQLQTRLNEYVALSRLDPLTGLLNRRTWSDIAEAHFRTAQLHKRPLCLAMIDIDHFKSVNDRFGHLVGDKILKRLAHLLRSNLREQDVICRFGGEEFLILLPDTSESEAQQVLERLNRFVVHYQKQLKHLPTITLSTGLAERSPIDQSLEDLIHRADQNMYQIKKSTRLAQISYAV